MLPKILKPLLLARDLRKPWHVWLVAETACIGLNSWDHGKGHHSFQFDKDHCKLMTDSD